MAQYYTYMWLREDGTSYYVGKGSGRRAYTNHKITRQYRPESDARILVQYWGSEAEAFEMEKWWIKFWGRKDLGTGILLNRTDGGEGSNTFLGRHHTEEAKRKIGESKKGNTAWLGKTHTPEERKRISERNIAMGLKPSFKGRQHSEESKKRMSEAHIQTHCKRGHELSGSNLYVYKGIRFCAECRNVRQRLRRQNEEKSTRVGRDGSGRFVSVRIAPIQGL